MNVAARVCRSPDSWLWTDYSQISLMHSPTPPKCSMRAIMALIKNLGIVYHQYCSSSEGAQTPHRYDMDVECILKGSTASIIAKWYCLYTYMYVIQTRRKRRRGIRSCNER
jgi:hypothetical protein